MTGVGIKGCNNRRMSIISSRIDNVLQENLTEAQRLAVIDPANYILCLACAGSGKSRTLAYRIAYLIANGCDPKGIVAFTFTEKAAEAIKRRVADALDKCGLPSTYVGAMYIGTIHSYCHHLLGCIDAGYRQFEVLDENRLKLYLLSRYYDLRLVAVARNRKKRMFETIREMSNAWQTVNDEMIEICDIKQYDTVIGSVLERLKAGLNKDRFLDFSAMIRLAIEALKRNEASVNTVLSELRHVLVDEYQDINPSQEQLIEELRKRSDALFVVGDDDQAIYGWRGADVSKILTFEHRYPSCSTHTLSTNFRSTGAIVEASNRFIHEELGPSRIDKQPVSCADGNIQDFRNLWFETRDSEAQWVAERIASLLGARYVEEHDEHGRAVEERGLTPGDFAILFRSIKRTFNPQNLPHRHYEFTSELRRLGIPYTIDAEGGVFERPYASAVRATMELLRQGAPTRSQVKEHFRDIVLPAFPDADFDQLIRVLTKWNSEIHTPPGGARRKVYPQEFLHEMLHAFGVHRTDFDAVVMRDLGVFSSIILDVEKVYVSIDSPGRYREMLNFLQNVAESGYDTSTLDLISKPDAVSISTIHKAKGLEFPVVFIVDVVNQRFPSRCSTYEGWLPKKVMKNAIDRGAYGTRKEDEARLFYTAMTRAERFLYVTGSSVQPDTKNDKKPSAFKRRLSHPRMLTEPTGFPKGIETRPQKRRFEEDSVPTSYSEIKDYLICPRQYRLRRHYGFNPPVPELFGFGLTTHAVIGRLHQSYRNVAPTSDEADGVLDEVFHLKHVFPSNDPENRPGPYERAKNKSAEIIHDYIINFKDDFIRLRENEARFEIKVGKALISGSIDLLLKEDETGNILDAHVVDFKSMDTPDDNRIYDWVDLSLQVQLYAFGAREVLDENAKTGSVHLLREGNRIEIPVSDEAIGAAVRNVEWAVERILDDDFPMRPSSLKCTHCDYQLICPKKYEDFRNDAIPPEVYVPTKIGKCHVRAFSDVEDEDK